MNVPHSNDNGANARSPNITAKKIKMTAIKANHPFTFGYGIGLTIKIDMPTIVNKRINGGNA